MCCERGWHAGSNEGKADVRDLRRAGVIRSVVEIVLWRTVLECLIEHVVDEGN